MTPSIGLETTGVRRAGALASGAYLPWVVAGLYFAVSALTASKPTNGTEVTLAAVLLAAVVLAYTAWQKERRFTIPAFACLCGSHFMYYGSSIFTAARRSPSVLDGGADLTDTMLESAMLVGLISFAAIAAGRALGQRVAPAYGIRLRLLEYHGATPVRIRALMAMGIAASIMGNPLTGEWRAVGFFLFDRAPLTATIWAFLASEAPLDRLLVAASVGARVIFTPEASLASIVFPLLSLGMASVLRKGRIPWKPLLLVGATVVFFQPAKGIVRGEIQQGLVAEGPQALMRWAEVSVGAWAETLTAGSEAAAQNIEAVGSRTSLITLSAVVLDKTPGLVPFQYGSTYSFLLVTLVPRVVWPDKPTVSEANQFYQVEYGLTAVEDLSAVSIACGFASEGYMNFGWSGTLGVSLLIGILFGVYEYVCFRKDSSLATVALGLSLLPNFLQIEGQVAAYLGGLIQTLVTTMVLFWTGKRATEGSSERKWSRAK